MESPSELGGIGIRGITGRRQTERRECDGDSEGVTWHLKFKKINPSQRMINAVHTIQTTALTNVFKILRWTSTPQKFTLMNVKFGRDIRPRIQGE